MSWEGILSGIADKKAVVVRAGGTHTYKASSPRFFLQGLDRTLFTTTSSSLSELLLSLRTLLPLLRMTFLLTASESAKGLSNLLSSCTEDLYHRLAICVLSIFILLFLASSTRL